LNLRRLHSGTDETFRCLFVGQISIRKGIPDLLEAWRLLNWQDAELWLVGREANDIQSVLDQYRHLPGLRWLGHVDNIADIYAQTDVFVFPSLEEGSALVTYEAMASELPLVLTHNSGSVARDDTDGFLVPIRSPQQIADKLETLRRDPKLRRQMGQNGRSRILTYTWDNYRQKLSQAMEHAAS